MAMFLKWSVPLFGTLLLFYAVLRSITKRR